VSGFDVSLRDGEVLLHNGERSLAQHFFGGVDVAAPTHPSDGEGMSKGVRATSRRSDMRYLPQISDENAKAISGEGVADMSPVGGDEERCCGIDLSPSIG
jgi:hypothetical protein